MGHMFTIAYSLASKVYDVRDTLPTDCTGLKQCEASLHGQDPVGAAQNPTGVCWANDWAASYKMSWDGTHAHYSLLFS